MVRVALGLLCTVLAGVPTVAQEANAPAKQAVESGIVRVQETRPRSEPALPVPGIVTPDGHVLTLMGAVSGNAPVRVVTSTGRACEITGVANYLSSVRVILFTVDWKGEVPPVLPLADRGAEVGQQVTLMALNMNAGAEPSTFRGKISEKRSSHGLELIDAATPDGIWGGGPAFNDAGQIVGLMGGFVLHVGVPLAAEGVRAGPQGSKLLNSVPVDFLTPAIKPLDAELTLEQWRAKEAEIDEAAKLCRDARDGFGRDEFVESLRCARRSVMLDDRSSAGWAMLSHILHKIGSFEEALKAASKAAELAPGDPQYVYRRAYVLLQMGRTDDALLETERLVARAPDRADFLHLHAVVLWQAKKPAAAIEVMERAAKLNPTNPKIQKFLEAARAELKAT